MTQLPLPGLEDEAVRHLVVLATMQPGKDEHDEDESELLTLQEWLDKGEGCKLEAGGSKDPCGVSAYVNLELEEWYPADRRYYVQLLTRNEPFTEALGSPPELATLQVPELVRGDGYLPLQGCSPTLRLTELAFLDHQGGRHALTTLRDLEDYTVDPTTAEKPERVLFSGYDEATGIGVTLDLPLHGTEGRLHLRVRPARLRTYWIEAIRYKLTSRRDHYVEELAKHQSLLDKRDAAEAALADFTTHHPQTP